MQSSQAIPAFTAEETAIPGLKLVSDFVTAEEEEELVNYLGHPEVSTPLDRMETAWERVSRRFVKHFGFRFDYATRTFSESLGPLPSILEKMALRISALAHVGVELDQVRPRI